VEPLYAKHTVGVIGGMGPAAAAYFGFRIAQLTFARRDQDHLHVIIDNEPSIPDRSDFLLGGDQDPAPALIAVAQRLVQVGADLLVIPCNSASPFRQCISDAVPVIVIDWASEVIDATVKSSPGAPVGLLATEGAVAADVYQSRLTARGLAVTLPDREMQHVLSEVIHAAKRAPLKSAEMAPYRDSINYVVRRLIKMGTASLLIGCTELSMLFADMSKEWPVATIDSLNVVAARTVVLAGGSLRPQRWRTA
jgi:aspartate racemase